MSTAYRIEDIREDTTRIFLGEKNIDDEGAKALAKALEGCKNLTELHLNQNNIGDEGAKALVKALEGCKNLTGLVLNQNNIGDEGAKALVKALEGCKNLTGLVLNQNNIGDECAKALVKALEGCKNLTVLGLHHNNFGDEVAKAVAKVLEGCENFEAFCLSGSRISDEGINTVAKALEGCKNLKAFVLMGYSIGDEVSKALEGCKNLKSGFLIMQCNIGDEGAKAVAKALEGCKNLTGFGIMQCNIGDEGAKAVAKALEGCKNLTDFAIAECNIGDEGAKAVAKALEGCKNLTDFAIWKNNISDEGAKAVAKTLHKTHPSVRIEFYDGNPSLTPKELFAKVCSPGEDIDSLDTESWLSLDAASEPSVEPKSEQDGVVGAGLVAGPCNVDIAAMRPDSASVSFADVVQLANQVSNSRAGQGGGGSVQTGIALLEEFVGPAIQGYFGQMKLQQASSDIKISKASLDRLQDQIRASSRDGLHGLVKQRNAERDRLRALVKDVYPWVCARDCEDDDDVVRAFKVKIASLLEDLNTNDVSVAGGTCADEFERLKELASQSARCVEEYKMNQKGRPNNIGQRSDQAVRSIISRANELQLGDAFWITLRTPEQATRFTPELVELQNALQEELEVLRRDTLSARVFKTLAAIGFSLQRLYPDANRRARLKIGHKLSPKEISEMHDFIELGSKEPNIFDVEVLYQGLAKSRKATESLKRAREALETEDLDEEEQEHYRNRIKKQELILSQGSPIELSKAFRHKLAETLQHAQKHYPELLLDSAWLERMHINAEGVFEVAFSDLWLANVKISDFQPVGKPLTSRGGKRVQKVLDNFGKTVVLKQFQLGDSSQYKVFYKQAANLGKVVSQHVIRITGAFVDIAHGEPRGCIVMPFYEQGDLAKWIQDHPNEGKVARDRLAMGLLTGMVDIHTCGIVHCDIKPENIFLTSNGTPLIGDFDGIKVADCTATYTSVQATPRYIAPELQSGPVTKFETAMDMYSVGVVFEDLYPEPTTAMQRLIENLKATDPGRRISAKEALKHEAFGAPKIPLETCLVCFEAIALTEGTSCEEGDFFCRDCVASSVEAAAQPQASVLVGADGTMSCVRPGCTGRITGQEITRLAPSALDHLLLIAKMRAESEASARAEQEIQRRIAEALQVDGLTRDVRRHLLHIQENILNTCCPNCHACFDQFDACCAVKCGNGTCGHHFCAWCLAYSSPNSRFCHDHVRTCSRKLGQDPFFAESFEQVREGWRILRAERLREYWSANVHDRNLRLSLQEQLSPLLTPDLVGPGFRLE